MTKKAHRPSEKGRDNPPLLFIMLVLVPLFGGYYNFSVFLCGAVLVLLLLHTSRRAKSIRIPTGWAAWCLYALCGVMLLSVPFGVSPGMAFTGFLRTGVWVLFFLYAATYNKVEREAILDAVAYEGAILSFIAIVSFLWNSVSGIADANGRIDGPFQYANTWALYLLCSLVLLALKEKRGRWDYPAMAALLCGIYLSGSRGIFLLLLPLGLGYGVWYMAQRRRILPLVAGVGVVVAVGAVSVVMSGGMVLSRLQAITLTASSLNGRILYYLDGLQMILEHPMGVGRGGYLYLQPLYQTGVYTLKFIHNEYLQAALDGGIAAGLLTIALLLLFLFRTGCPLRERVVVFAIAAHACIDFDFQFTVIMFLLLLCASGGACREFRLPKGKGMTLAGVGLTLVLGFFSTVYFLDFAGQSGAAYALYPLDLTLAENKLQSCGGLEKAEPVAQKIIDRTPVSMLAWDCKFAACATRADTPGMVRAKYQYLRLNKYRGEVYEEFTTLLESAVSDCSPGEREEYRTLAQLVLAQLKEVNESTSPLAYRIADKPNLTFSEELIARLKNL